MPWFPGRAAAYREYNFGYYDTAYRDEGYAYEKKEVHYVTEP